MAPQPQLEAEVFEEVRVRDALLVPNPKQVEAILACNSRDFDHIGMGGSIGAGKTQWGGRTICAWAWQYPADYLVIRETTRRLEDSTKKAMLKGDGGLPPCVPRELYHLKDLRVVDNEVKLKSGGVIKFRHAENAKEAVDAVKNMTLGGYFIDQVEELDGDEYEEFFDILNGRLRAPGTPMKGLTVSNPGPEDHWYFRRVVDEKTRDDGVAYVHVTLHDNAHNLPEKYVKNMLATEFSKPDWFKRYILGEWGAFGGKRFKNFDRRVHVIDPFPIPKHFTVIEGLDYGWAHAFVCVWVAISDDGVHYVVGEHVATEMRIREHAKAIKHFRRSRNLPPSASWLDPNAWTSRGEFEAPAFELALHGIGCAKAQNDRLGGWDRIEDLLEEGKLKFFRDLTDVTVKQLASARIKKGTDDVEKKNDDAIDALRYAIMSHQPLPDKPEEPDRHEEYARRMKDRAERREREETMHLI